MRSKFKSLFGIFYRSIKIFSFSFWSIKIIFACHYLEISCKGLFNIFCNVSLRWLRIDRLSSFPIILYLWIKEMVISYPIRWCLVNVLELIGILMLSSTFIEILLVLLMITVIILTVCYIGSIIPLRHISPPGLIGTNVESIHVFICNFFIFFR